MWYFIKQFLKFRNRKLKFTKRKINFYKKILVIGIINELTSKFERSKSWCKSVCFFAKNKFFQRLKNLRIIKSNSRTKNQFAQNIVVELTLSKY